MSGNKPEYYYVGEDGGIFARFPELIPEEGEYYDSDAHNRLLVIVESNYFKNVSDISSCFRNPIDWYEGNDAKLIPQDYIRCVSNWKYEYFKRAINIANNMLTEPHLTYDYKTGEYGPVAQNEIAFYNYFLRPADADKSLEFRPSPIDLEYAGKAMEIVIEKLKPQLVVFLSKKSHKAYKEYMKANGVSHSDIVIGSVAHPSCIWWNRHNGAYGKEAFRKLLEENWLKR